MKRAALVLFAFLAMSCAQAQDSYFGIHLDVASSPNLSLNSVYPLAGLQLGGPISDNMELHVSGFLLVFANFLQVDVLYTQNLSDTLRGYGGVGGDLGLLGAIFRENGGSFAGVHATAGVEYQLGSGIGLFGEAQPLFVLHEVGFGIGDFLGKLNLGINFHF